MPFVQVRATPIASYAIQTFETLGGLAATEVAYTASRIRLPASLFSANARFTFTALLEVATDPGGADTVDFRIRMGGGPILAVQGPIDPAMGDTCVLQGDLRVNSAGTAYDVYSVAKATSNTFIPYTLLGQAFAYAGVPQNLTVTEECTATAGTFTLREFRCMVYSA